MSRPGVVLVFALLAIVLIELLSLSAFGFARMANAASRASVQTLALRQAAEAAAWSAAGALDARAAASRAEGTVLQLPAPSQSDLHVSIEAETLSNGFQLIRARAAPEHGAGVAAHVLVRVLTREAVLGGFEAVVSTHAPMVPLSAGSTAAAPSCISDVTDPVHPRRLLEPGDTLPLGDRVGVSWDDLRRIADATGAPPDDAPRMIHLQGLHTISGMIAGVVAVDGDLILAAGAAVRGLLTVRGTLIVHEGAEVAGAVRARAIATGVGNIRPDGCAVNAAFEAPAFGRVYRPGPRWRLPAF